MDSFFWSIIFALAIIGIAGALLLVSGSALVSLGVSVCGLVVFVAPWRRQ